MTTARLSARWPVIYPSSPPLLHLQQQSQSPQIRQKSSSSVSSSHRGQVSKQEQQWSLQSPQFSHKNTGELKFSFPQLGQCSQRERFPSSSNMSTWYSLLDRKTNPLCVLKHNDTSLSSHLSGSFEEPYFSKIFAASSNSVAPNT